MRLLLDMNLPYGLVRRLREQGNDVEHAMDLGLARAPDQEVIGRAEESGRVLVTSDLDFGEIVGNRKGTGLGVILLRLHGADPSQICERITAAIENAGEALATSSIVLVEDFRLRIRRPR